MPERSPADRIGRLLSGLVRQLELPFFGGASSTGTEPPPPDARGRNPRARPTTDPRRSTVDPTTRRVRLGERALDYTLRRARRKTIGFTISASGLVVTAPRWVGIGQIEGALRERETWILAKLADMRRHQASIPQVAWEDGGTLPYRGEPITLRVAGRPGGKPSTAPARATRSSATYDATDRTLTVTLPPGATREQLRDRVEAWLQAEARALFKERLALYEARLGIRHRLLRLSSAKTRWGSCSADGRILLNWRLIHFPLSSIDYVVAHELAHLKEMNHGPRFWATVATILPDFEAARAHVKNPPPELLPTL